MEGSQIQIVQVDDSIVRRMLANNRSMALSETLGEGQPVSTVIARGDILDISLWEAPPAALFGISGGDSKLPVAAASTSAVATATTANTAKPNSFPEQMVDDSGSIVVPFVGAVQVAGLTPRQVEADIVARLAGKAHAPQAIVQIAHNASANVTVVGDVTTSLRVPLTSHGERLLDALASAGGVKQPIGKTTIQVARAGKVVAMPLEQIIRDPAQNIRLQAEDVVTAYFQPYSFISLGATGTSTEMSFEGTGITLAQALGRIGGLRDDRANTRGVFVFRLEDPSNLDLASGAKPKTTPDGKIPVIYRVDLSNPAGFFIAQSFPVRDKDILYVTNGPAVDIQKFVTLVSSMAFAIVGPASIVK